MPCHRFGGALPVLIPAGVYNIHMLSKRICQPVGHQITGHGPEALVHIVDVLISIQQILIVQDTYDKAVKLVVQIVEGIVGNLRAVRHDL